MASARPCARFGFKILLDARCEKVSLLIGSIRWWRRLASLDSYKITVGIQFGLTKLIRIIQTKFSTENISFPF